MRLFNEAEAIVDREDGDNDQQSNADTIAVPAHRRKRGGRKPLPPELPRIEVVHELPESERVCPHDGATLRVIDEVKTEQLDIIPAQVRVIRHLRKKYSYALIKTAKANNIEPYQYLRRVFAELPNTKTVEDVEALLPYSVELKSTDDVKSAVD